MYKIINTMSTFKYTTYKKQEEEDIMNMSLSKMNDTQIEKYVKLTGRSPSDEWNMKYEGDDILRYSYCNFVQWGIEDQTVTNITITRATFDEITFTNYVFDNVIFEECVFRDIVLNNTTFKNSKFIGCELDSSMVPDKSCEVINYNDYDHDDHDYYEESDYEEETEEDRYERQSQTYSYEMLIARHLATYTNKPV
jgi:hypothetical protein